MSEAFTILVPNGVLNTIKLTSILRDELKLSEDDILVAYDGEYD